MHRCCEGRTLLLLDRYPFNSPWVRAWFDRWFLKAWFAIFALRTISYLMASSGAFGFDVRLYQLAASTWLAGGDPWAPRLFFSDEVGFVGYAGPPQTLLPFLLLAWIPPDVLVLGFALASANAALWVLRRLGLPYWWIAFPPIVEGWWVGNLNIFVIALLVLGGRVAGVMATTLKAYAAIPLLITGGWRTLVIAGVLAVVTAPFLPWLPFLEQYPTITATLADQAWGGRTSMLTSPLVILGGAIGLALLGRKRAAWLIVPVLWPSTQLHYSVLALPVMTPWLALCAAVPDPGMMGFGVIVLALAERIGQVRRRPRGGASERSTRASVDGGSGDLA